MKDSHRLRAEHVGVGWARCWIVACACGWKAPGSASTRRAAVDFLMPSRCPEDVSA